MNLIAAHLQNTGTTQKAFAAAVGVSQQTVFDWVHGNKRPTGARIRPVAAQLGISPESLVLALHLPPAEGAPVVHGVKPATGAARNCPKQSGGAA